jgi:hypothetical protein
MKPMGTLAVIIMIILFFLLLAFVFSTALLTPLIGKKNLLFVVALGFVVGIIGGAFFISPVFNDIPDMVRGFHQSTSESPEIIEANISTDVDVNRVIADIKSLEGVKGVDTVGITLKTTPIPSDWVRDLESRAPTSNPNITALKVESNDTILISTTPGADPPSTIQNLKDWIMLISGIDVSYSIVKVRVTVDPSQVDAVVEKMPQLQAVVISVQGPLEEDVEWIQNVLPNQSNVILFCGLLGVLTGLAGVFIDTILQSWQGFRNKIKKE